MQKKYIISLDQGTTSSRAIIFDTNQNVIEVAQKEFQQIYTQSGYVEHDPMEIYAAGLAVGVWNSLDDIKREWTLDRMYQPNMSEEKRITLRKGWKKAVSRSLDWEDHK